MTQDEDQLRLLSIFHYVVGGLAGFFALFPIFHLIVGLFFIFAPNKFAGKGEPPPAFIGWFFVIFAAMFIALGWVFAAFCLHCRAFSRETETLFVLPRHGGRGMYLYALWHSAWSFHTHSFDARVSETTIYSQITGANAGERPKFAVKSRVVHRPRPGVPQFRH